MSKLHPPIRHSVGAIEESAIYSHKPIARKQGAFDSQNRVPSVVTSLDFISVYIRYGRSCRCSQQLGRKVVPRGQGCRLAFLSTPWYIVRNQFCRLVARRFGFESEGKTYALISCKSRYVSTAKNVNRITQCPL